MAFVDSEKQSESADLHHGRESPVVVSNEEHKSDFLSQIKTLYDRTLSAGDYAANYWADTSVHSNSVLAPLAAVPGVIASLWTHDTATNLSQTYRQSTQAGEMATQYWADISVNSKHPLAPLATVPGLFAALWTPETAPSTAITLGTAMYGFGNLPKQLTHFTTAEGAAGIAESGAINASRGAFSGIPKLGGLFGPGVYMARIGPPLNFFIRSSARIPITLQTPAVTVRIIPYLVYVRWGTAPLIMP